MKVTLIVTEGPHAGREFGFDQHDSFIVGRATTAQFQLAKEDGYFSRNHFLVEVNPPLCRLLDLQSRNGTFVNGQRVKNIELRNNDLIRGGKTVLRISIEAAADANAATASIPLIGEQTVVPRNFPLMRPETPSSASPPETPLQQTMVPMSGLPAPPIEVASVDGPHRYEADSSSGSTRDANATDLPCFPGFQVIREIGRGGMGIVYAAKADATGDEFAIKVVTPAVAASPDDLARFVREASILKELVHPHIVPFREMNHAQGQLFFVMDLIQGRDVDHVIKSAGQPWQVNRAVSVACQLLDALAFAHARGYVHRDVKPSNLILESRAGRDHAWLADFGLARAYQSSRLSGLTLTGAIGGTTPYMPPEQITHYRNVDPAADQYAAAATLYYLLTKTHVYDFPSDVTQQLLMILQDDPTPITERRSDLPGSLVSAIHKSLHRNPKQRFPDVNAFRQALEQAVRL